MIEKGENFEQHIVIDINILNINGSINTKDHTDIVYIDCESVNAESTKKLYQKALEKHPKAKKVQLFPSMQGITGTKN